MTDSDIRVMSALDRARQLWGDHFRYLTAEEWGMVWKRPAVPEKLNDPEAFVHHTAGSRLGTDAVRAFQALNRWAQQAKNYSALDYDLLVHLDVDTGLITVGAGRAEWMSAATKDRNELGEAVCLMGYFTPGHVLSEHPTLNEVRGVALAIAIGIEEGWIARDAVILGHRDNPAHPNATGCPGGYLYPYLPEIRDMVELLLAPEEDDMAYKFIDIDGYQDQFLVVPISGETKRRMGAVGSTPLTLGTDKPRAELEQFFGYKLTPR